MYIEALYTGLCSMLRIYVVLSLDALEDGRLTGAEKQWLTHGWFEAVAAKVRVHTG